MSELLEYAELVAFVASTDLERSRGFYEGVLGLRVQRTTPSVLVLVGGGTAVRVTLVEQFDPAPYTVLGWVVQNVEETVRTLAARGVRFESYDNLEQDEYGIWQSPSGSRVAWLKDPDGNVLSITQH